MSLGHTHVFGAYPWITPIHQGVRRLSIDVPFCVPKVRMSSLMVTEQPLRPLSVVV